MARVCVTACLFSCCLFVFSVLLAACGDEHPLKPEAAIGTIVIDANPDSIGGPWRLDGPSGDVSAGAGDTILGGMVTGRYRLTWGGVADWSLPVPASSTDSLAGRDSLSFQGIYTRIPDKGYIAVEVIPDMLAAPWLLTGPDFFSYGGTGSAVLGGLPVGHYTITWQELTAWVNLPPVTLDAAVTKNDTTRFTHAYFPSPTYWGNLRIQHTAPSGDFAFNWELTRSMDDTFFLAGEGDTLLVGLPQDSYSVWCKPIPGFIIEFPFQDHQGDVAIARVWVGRESVVHAIYIPDEAGMGIVRITPVPAELQAPWTLTGPYGLQITQAGDFFYQAPPGEFTLTWGAVEGWAAPVPAQQQLDLPFAGAIEFVGTYLSLAPLVVPDFAARAGDRIGSVDLLWSAVTHTLAPIEDYLVVCSTEGTITLDNWSEARPLATVPAGPGQQTYTLSLDAANDGMVPGLPTWFSVRARDGQGALSPPTPEVRAVPTYDRQVTGRVTDGRGEPASGLPLETTNAEGLYLRTVTDADGNFTFAGIPSNLGFDLQTRSADLAPGEWFDYRFTAGEGEEVNGLRIGLVPRHPTDPACGSRYPDFLDYLLQMTKTDDPTNTRPDRRLHKWDRWPLEVFLQENPAGIALDFPELTALAMNQWNATMGQTLFVATDDSSAAEVVVVFSDEIPQVNGQVTMLAPPGAQFIGDAVPEKMGLYLNTAMTAEQRIIEVAMHEMGHILGIAGHSLCYEAGYLMYISSAGALDGGIENAVHPDEQMLVRTIRNLPQSVDMAGYVRQ